MRIFKKFIAIAALFAMTISVSAQNVTVKGSIKDASGEPIIGATVMQTGTNNGTVTDLDGNYQLSVPSNATLTFTCIGYTDQVVAVAGKSAINVVLEEDNEMLEETVVIGYGVQRKSDVTGAIASVKATDLENRSATDVAQALQGKAAGVQIINSSGAPGSGSSIQIRGYSSNSKTSPLMIVDGLKVSDISYLDPDMIASIEILKDAASAAIYGVEAGNGVVLITTKTGSSENGKGRVTYSFQNAIQTLARKPEIMHAKDYMNYMLLSGAAKESDFASWDGKTDTDWIDLMTEKGYQRRHTLGFQGGNDRAKFYASLSYTDNNGIIKGDKDTHKRLVGQVNAEYKINNWLTTGVNLTIDKGETRSLGESSSTQSSVFGAVLADDPMTPLYYEGELPAYAKSFIAQNITPFGRTVPMNNEGKVYGIPLFPTTSYMWNPQILLDQRESSTKSFRVRGTAYLNIAPFKGFVFTSRLGFQGGYSHTNTYNYEEFLTWRNVQNMSISASENDRLYYQWENFANYNTTIARKHAIQAMAGMSYQATYTDNLSGSADKLTYDVPLYRYLSNSVNTSNMSVSGQPNNSANMSFFARLGYTYDNRYFVQGNFRADAYDSSKLDKRHRWGFFPSVSGGWNISNEKFMKSFKEKTGITFMKLRASWGINGNVNALGAYQYAASMRADEFYGTDFGQGFVIGVRPSTILPNPTIKWETSRQFDLGLDVRAFRERLTFTVDWYNKNTHDLLTSTTAPSHTGAETTYVNAGLVNNHGTEFELGWRDHIGDFSYSINGNLSTVHNKVIQGTAPNRVPGQKIWSSEYVTYFEEGYPLWYLRTFFVDHIDQQTGAAVYKDFNNDGVINLDDQDYAGSGIPKFTYGITINLAYKGFDFVLLGSGSQGASLLYSVCRADANQQNTLAEFYTQAWQSPSSTGYKYPKPDVGDKFYRVSNMRVYDASFFKIKQMQLGYSLPKSLLKKTFIGSLRVYASLDDFFTFTKYPGMDPEVSHFGMSASGLGIDYGSYPISKKVVFGVNISL